MLVPIILLAQTLYFKTPAGDVYTAVNDVPAGACVLTGVEELVFEVTNFNTCNEIVLQPGCYRAELRGGAGQNSAHCLDVLSIDNLHTESALFSVSEPTTVYALRGGDGNPGQINVDVKTGSAAGHGGGASGVDSILVVGKRVWRANGAPGVSCPSHLYRASNNINTSTGCGMGLAGAAPVTSYVSQVAGFQTGDGAVARACGGGGGGAPNGAGGQISRMYPLLNDGIAIGVGGDASADGGGDGGDVISCANASCSELVTVHGGSGGKNVYYSCGGQVAVSYGGGGGGAAVLTGTSSVRYADGGDGGSGSTGTSDVSLLRIYKM